MELMCVFVCVMLRSERGAGAAAADEGRASHGAGRHAGGHRGLHQVTKA